MNSKPATDLQASRDAIMAEVARAIHSSDASITNIESAIARANVPMQDIAAEFGGKRELLLAMVSELSDAMSEPIGSGEGDADVKQRLLEFGRCVTDRYATSHLRGLYRIAITESIRHTGLGRDFYEVGPGHLTKRLADFLRLAQARGELRGTDPQLLAGHFLSLLRTNVDVADSFPHELATSQVARDAYVSSVVDLFCDGINGGRPPC